jgi:hypothetical protein
MGAEKKAKQPSKSQHLNIAYSNSPEEVHINRFSNFNEQFSEGP